MSIAVLIGQCLGSRSLIFREKQFLCCLGNTKFTFVHPVYLGVSPDIQHLIKKEKKYGKKMFAALYIRIDLFN